MRCGLVDADLHATGSAVAATEANANEMQELALILGGGGQRYMRLQRVM